MYVTDTAVRSDRRRSRATGMTKRQVRRVANARSRVSQSR
jgi:hypothetical protein